MLDLPRLCFALCMADVRCIELRLNSYNSRNAKKHMCEFMSLAFALAIMMCKMLKCRLPWDAKSLRWSISDELRDVLLFHTEHVVLRWPRMASHAEHASLFIVAGWAMLNSLVCKVEACTSSGKALTSWRWPCCCRAFATKIVMF